MTAPTNQVLPTGSSLSVKTIGEELCTNHQPSIKWHTVESFKVETNLAPALLLRFIKEALRVMLRGNKIT